MQNGRYNRTTMKEHLTNGLKVRGQHVEFRIYYDDTDQR